MASNNSQQMEFPVHSDLREPVVSNSSNSTIDYNQLLRAMSSGSGNSSIHTALSQFVLEKAQQDQVQRAGPSNLQQRGSTTIKTSEMVDFEGRVASRTDVIKVNPAYPLGVVQDHTREILGGRDLPSTNNIKSYPKNILPNHTLFKIVNYEIVNFDFDKKLSTQFILKPVINSDGVTWLQSDKCFSNYLNAELPWELKIGMSKIYRDAILGNSKRVEGEKSETKLWNPTGWYLYVNPFSDRNEKINMYKGSVSLSFSFLSPDCDMKIYWLRSPYLNHLMTLTRLTCVM